MNKVYIFEQSHIDGFGQTRIDAYIVVENFEVGDELIDRTIENTFSNKKKFDIRKDKKNHIAIVTLKEGADGQTTLFNNCILRVFAQDPVSKEIMIDKLNKPKEPNYEWNNRNWWIVS